MSLRKFNDFREGGIATKIPCLTNGFLGVYASFSRNGHANHWYSTAFIRYFQCVFAPSQNAVFPRNFQHFRECGSARRIACFANGFLGFFNTFSRNGHANHWYSTAFIRYFVTPFPCSQNLIFLTFSWFLGCAFPPPQNLVLLMVFNDFIHRFQFLAPKIYVFPHCF